jgi:antitoxin PrlF
MVNQEIHILLGQAEELKRQAAKLLEMAERVEDIATHVNQGEDEGSMSANQVFKQHLLRPSHNTFRAKIRQKGQVTIPAKVRTALGLDEGDGLLGSYDISTGEVRLVEDVIVEPEKAWFWKDQWQEMLVRSVGDLIDGRAARYDRLSDAVNEMIQEKEK